MNKDFFRKQQKFQRTKCIITARLIKTFVLKSSPNLLFCLPYKRVLCKCKWDVTVWRHMSACLSQDHEIRIPRSWVTYCAEGESYHAQNGVETLFISLLNNGNRGQEYSVALRYVFSNWSVKIYKGTHKYIEE